MSQLDSTILYGKNSPFRFLLKLSFSVAFQIHLYFSTLNIIQPKTKYFMKAEYTNYKESRFEIIKQINN